MSTPPFTDAELDLMDELYFIQHWDQLLEALDWSPLHLRSTLWSLIQKGYVRTASLQDGQEAPAATSPDVLKHCHFLATKEGLLALHTSR